MIRVIVDAGSSIKPEEKEKYNVDIIPIRVMLDNEDFLDGVDLDFDYFYRRLIEDKVWPKTSLPNLADVEELVTKYTDQGDEVIILTISSGISGTYNAIKMLLEDNKLVHVVDTKVAVGGVRILVDEINKHKDEGVEACLKYVEALIPRIKTCAIPETLNYLRKGGRLSYAEWLLGSVVGIKPLIGIENGKVKMLGKKIGIIRAMKHLATEISETADTSYSVVASYSYNDSNLQKLISMVSDDVKKAISINDNLDPAIACHWGPNAFGFVYVGKE